VLFALPVLAASALAPGCHARSGDVAADVAVTSVAAPRSTGSAALQDEFWERTKRVFNVPVANSPVLGPAGALVTIVEFSEFQCTPCNAMEATLKAIHAKYGDQVRLVWKNKPLLQQPAAEAAAEAALEVRAEKGDAAFWEVHDRFVEQQDGLLLDKEPNIAAIIEIASVVGANTNRLREAISGHTHQEEIDRDLDLAEDFEVESTPHLFVNGRQLEGLQPQARLERMIEEELAKAHALLAAGTPAQDLYEKMVVAGPGPWHPKSKPLLDLPKNDPALGGPKAKVTIHVWSDYQCALCVAVERTMSQLQTDYGDRIRFVWHDLPLSRHEDARRVALAEREAYEQQGAPGFWALHHKIFFAAQVPTAFELAGFARDAKLDINKWQAALEHNTHAGEIEADERAARAEGITETPAFLVATGNAAQGSFVGNIEYASKLRRVIEEALNAE
jgi:protein-disulfide isomerase